MDTRQTVGQRLKQARERKGFTLRAVCERLPGMTESKLGNYERGYRLPDLDTFRQLGRVLETSPAYLTTLNDDLLSDQERDLLACFRRLTPHQQQTLMNVCTAFIDTQSPPAEHPPWDGTERRRSAAYLPTPRPETAIQAYHAGG